MRDDTDRDRTRLASAGRLAELRLRNGIQTALLIAGMLGLSAALAHLLWGPAWIPWFVVLLAIGLATAPRLSPDWLMRLSGARALHPQQAPELYALVASLAERAGLARVPRLYWVPRGLLNAFAVGTSEEAAIAVTEGLLRTLRPRELAGVLAHEVAHIRSGDMRVMLLAELVARLTGAFGTVGLFLAVLNLPLLVLGATPVSWWLIVVLLVSPSLSVLLQLALSRARERAADLEAVGLTGDPRALASALHKIGSFEQGLLESIFFRHRHGPESPWLRTHPATHERVRALLALEAGDRRRRRELSEPDLAALLGRLPAHARRHYFVR